MANYSLAGTFPSLPVTLKMKLVLIKARIVSVTIPCSTFQIKTNLGLCQMDVLLFSLFALQWQEANDIFIVPAFGSFSPHAFFNHILFMMRQHIPMVAETEINWRTAYLFFLPMFVLLQLIIQQIHCFTPHRRQRVNHQAPDHRDKDFCWQ